MFDKEDLRTLATLAMPFGKYRGRPLIDLPEAYLLWFEAKGFPQGALEIKRNGLAYLLQPLKKPRQRSS